MKVSKGYDLKEGIRLWFALRRIICKEHGLLGCAHNRHRVGRSQRYLGPRLALRSPAMAVSRGPGFRVVGRSVGY